GWRLRGGGGGRARRAGRPPPGPQPRGGAGQGATGALTVLHAPEPATPYLSLFARTDSFTWADLEDALFESKSLVKQLAMRRTLFVFPRDLLPAAMSSPSAPVAHQEAGKLVKDLERSQVTDDGASWLATAREAVLQRLAGGAELGAKELREGWSNWPARCPGTSTSPTARFSTWHGVC